MRIEFNDSPWPLRPIGEIAEVLDRLRRPVNEDERRTRLGTVPYLGANGPVGTIDQHIFDEELVLVAEDGGFFFDDHRPIAYRWSGKCWVNNHAHVLRARDGVDPDWLAYCLAFVDVSRYVKGATRPKLNQGDLVKITIPLPSRDAQTRIVARLREAMVRVDEIESLQQERHRDSERLLGALLTEVFRELGSKYSPRTIGSVLRDSRYGTNTKCRPEPNDVAVLRIPNLSGGVLNLDDLKYCTREAVDEAATLTAGDLLIIRTNGSPSLVGRSAVYQPDPAKIPLTTPVSFASYLIRLRFEESQCIPEFVRYYLASSSGRQAINRIRRSSAGQSNINSANIKAIALPMPNVGEQREIVARLADIERASRALANEADYNVDTKILRTSVLRQAFSGKL